MRRLGLACFRHSTSATWGAAAGGGRRGGPPTSSAGGTRGRRPRPRVSPGSPSPPVSLSSPRGTPTPSPAGARPGPTPRRGTASRGGGGWACPKGPTATGRSRPRPRRGRPSLETVPLANLSLKSTEYVSHSDAIPLAPRNAGRDSSPEGWGTQGRDRGGACPGVRSFGSGPRRPSPAPREVNCGTASSELGDRTTSRAEDEGTRRTANFKGRGNEEVILALSPVPEQDLGWAGHR